MEINTFLILFLFFVLTIFLLKRFNILIDNTSYSEHKKIGKENFKPLVIGGFYITFVICYFLPEEFNIIKIFTILFFFLGLLSDKNYVSNPKIRLILQVIILSVLVFLEGLSIKSINISFFDKLLVNNNINLIFTVFCLSILLNGSNFLDGLNGLVTGYYLLVLTSLLYINNFPIDAHYISINEINLIEILLLSLTIFFIFNILGLVYLGDSGAYLLGLVIGVILIKANQQNIFISPFYVVNMLWYPAFENLFSLIRRLYAKHNISKADKFHLHQLVYRLLKSNKIVSKKIANPISALIILICNVPGILISNLVYWHTAYLIVVLVFNIVIYLSVFFLVSKNFVLKK
ncbi:MAG: hypothetical protein CL469_00660 [Acidimicrobiaceae bacterium]|nr:hypothetical protein [Acidimicrobiaceae bacterium]|tara:strand:- start:1693 stop:2733 length:1041 start_codon:yes stop_codon:yes gene_type:complete